MPYKVIKKTGAKPWKIVRLTDNKIVGSSTSAKKAYGSVAARLRGAGER
jgi:hypothetical protein